ncbi:MAG: hypothetical protein R3B69_02820 [Candidatus Paceibacterota bacterium]
MDEVAHAVFWEAPEHHHFEKGSDWFWALGIIALCGAVAAFFLGNFLLSLLIIIAACAMALVAARDPRVVDFAVTTRGVTFEEMHCISVQYPRIVCYR